MRPFLLFTIALASQSIAWPQISDPIRPTIRIDLNASLGPNALPAPQGEGLAVRNRRFAAVLCPDPNGRNCWLTYSDTEGAQTWSKPLDDAEFLDLKLLNSGSVSILTADTQPESHPQLTQFSPDGRSIGGATRFQRSHRIASRGEVVVGVARQGAVVAETGGQLDGSVPDIPDFDVSDVFTAETSPNHDSLYLIDRSSMKVALTSKGKVALFVVDHPLVEQSRRYYSASTQPGHKPVLAQAATVSQNGDVYFMLSGVSVKAGIPILIMRPGSPGRTTILRVAISDITDDRTRAGFYLLPRAIAVDAGMLFLMDATGRVFGYPLPVGQQN